MVDIWFHRYEDGRDIEGRFDYNSWQESEAGRKLSNTLDRDVVLAEGQCLAFFAAWESVLMKLFDRLQGVQDRPRLHGAHGRLAREQGPGDPP